jgi:hypothetical protein
MDFYTNDLVKVDGPSGSWGKVIAVYRHGVDCEWNYGKDVRGEYIKAISRSVSPYSLVHVPANFYYEYIKCPAWSPEQQEIYKRMMAEKVAA